MNRLLVLLGAVCCLGRALGAFGARGPSGGENNPITAPVTGRGSSRAADPARGRLRQHRLPSALQPEHHDAVQMAIDRQDRSAASGSS